MPWAWNLGFGQWEWPRACSVVATSGQRWPTVAKRGLQPLKEAPLARAIGTKQPLAWEHCARPSMTLGVLRVSLGIFSSLARQRPLAIDHRAAVVGAACRYIRSILVLMPPRKYSYNLTSISLLFSFIQILLTAQTKLPT